MLGLFSARRPASKPSARPALEALDGRFVPATLAFDQATGALSLVGTDHAETIRIERVGDQIQISYTDMVTGQTGTLSRQWSQVRQVRVDALGGNDRVENWTSAISVVHGGDGDDALVGGNGADQLYGGAGNDTLQGLGGNDLLDGGAGSDRLLASGPNLRLENGLLTGQGTDSIRNIEAATLTGTAQGDRLDARGWNGRVDIFGLGGDDALYGGNGADNLYGGDGKDILEGGAGADYLSGGAGNDKLYGGSGNDHLQGDDGNDDLHGGDGDDFMNGGNGSDEFWGSFGSDRMVGGKGADFFWDINAAFDHVAD